MNQCTDFLYHYTSIETLALILSNRTFRLNSLDQMDDLQEKETSDIKNIGQFCYISSWTDDETESIPMWKMYSSLDSGVRIKLKANPFKLFENTPESIKEVSVLPVTDEKSETIIGSPTIRASNNTIGCPSYIDGSIKKEEIERHDETIIKDKDGGELDE